MRFTALCRQVLEFEWSPKLEVKRVGSPSDIHSGSTPIWCRILKLNLGEDYEAEVRSKISKQNFGGVFKIEIW